MLMDAELARRYPIIPDAIIYHDYWFALSAAAHGGVYALKAPLYYYRLHDDNLAGVTPYQRFFSLNEHIKKEGFRKKLIGAFLFSRNNLDAISNSKLPVPWWTDLVIRSKLDFGCGYALWAIRNLRHDPAFARACLARSVGKLLFTLSIGR